MQSREGLSPRDHKYGFYLTVGSPIRFTTFKRNSVFRNITNFDRKGQRKYKMKRHFGSQNTSNSKQTEKQHMLPFMKKEAGLRVEPRAFNNYSLALRPNHSMYNSCLDECKNCFETMSTFTFHFLPFMKMLSVLIAPSSAGLYWRQITCHFK